MINVLHECLLLLLSAFVIVVVTRVDVPTAETSAGSELAFKTIFFFLWITFLTGDVDEVLVASENKDEDATNVLRLVVATTAVEEASEIVVLELVVEVATPSTSPPPTVPIDIARGENVLGNCPKSAFQSLPLAAGIA